MSEKCQHGTLRHSVFSHLRGDGVAQVMKAAFDAGKCSQVLPGGLDIQDMTGRVIRCRRAEREQIAVGLDVEELVGVPASVSR